MYGRKTTAIIPLSLCRLSVIGSGSSLLPEQLEPFLVHDVWDGEREEGCHILMVPAKVIGRLHAVMSLFVTGSVGTLLSKLPQLFGWCMEKKIMPLSPWSLPKSLRVLEAVLVPPVCDWICLLPELLFLDISTYFA